MVDASMVDFGFGMSFGVGVIFGLGDGTKASEVQDQDSAQV